MLITGCRESGHGHLVRADVVGMAIATPFVVRDHDLGLLRAHDLDHSFDRFIEIRLIEAGGVIVVGGARHA